MREIGSLAGEAGARMLADHLLTLDITTKLEPRGDRWVVWVHREEKVPEARAALLEFEAEPASAKFRDSKRAAGEIRERAERLDREARVRVNDLRERWEGPMYLRAPLAFALIVLSVAVTAGMHFFPRIDEYLFFSVRYFDRASMDDLGFGAIAGSLEVAHGEVWRLITPVFIHMGIFHLFFNMLALRYLGEKIEMRKGTWRLALICLVAAIGGDVGEFFKSGGAFGGMSGVVFALAGYLWIKGHVDPEDGLALDQRSVNWMLAWFLLGIIAPLGAGPETPHVFPYNMANVAHGVGLGVGMAFGLLRF